MKKIFLFCFISLVATQKILAQVSGVKNIPGDYATINAAIQHIMTVGLASHTILELQPGYTDASENFPITIPENFGTRPDATLTIRPSTSATGLTIGSGYTLNTPIFEIFGSYTTIDGRPGGTGSSRELTIISKAMYGSTIQFSNNAGYNTATFCRLEGLNDANDLIIPGGESGVVVFYDLGPFPVNTFNSLHDNTVSHCIIRRVNGTGQYMNGILAYGNPDAPNIGNKIMDNEIEDFEFRGIKVRPDGIGSSWTITGNSFYHVDPNAIHGRAIQFEPGTNSGANTIDNNFIGGNAPQCGGKMLGLISGIFLDVSHSTLTTVKNNSIKNIHLPSGAGGNFSGIYIKQGRVECSGNLIGGTDADFGIELSSALPVFKGIVYELCGPGSITQNTIRKIKLSSTVSSPTLGSKFFGIQTRPEANITISQNLIEQLNITSVGPTIITAIGPVTDPPPPGFTCLPSPTAVIDYNLFRNITATSEEDSATFTGIGLAGTVGPPTQLHYNQMYKINVSAVGGIASFTGININDRISGNTGNIIGSPTEANSIIVNGETVNAVAVLVNQSPDASISDDIIGNIKVNGTLSATLDGIRFQGGGVSKVTGNQLSDLSVSSAGFSTMNGISFIGAVTSSEPSTLHNNKVFKINVSSTDGTASFVGIGVNDRIAGNTGNIIGSPTDANSIVVTGKSATANGIRLKDSPDVSVSDDIIANIVATGTTTPASVNGIDFESGATAKISGNQVHHLAASVIKGIYIQPTSGSSAVTVEKNTVTGANNNTGNGIETFVASGATLNITATNNTVSNWQTGILLAAASGTTLQQSFQNNSVVSNQTGFVNQNGTSVNATCNWWGDASGPSGAGPGTGNPVGPNVIFSPWTTLSTYVAVDAGADQTINGSGSKTLTPTYTVCGTATYLWSTGATTPSITVSPTVTTAYTIKITDASGHEATDEVTVFVTAGLTVNIGPDQTICNGSVVTLTASVSGQNTNAPPPPTPFSVGGTADQLILNGHIDYLTIGNTMSQSEDRTNCNKNASSSKVLTIPAGAVIKKAYLYWSGSGSADNAVKLNSINVNAQNTKTHTRTGGFSYFGTRAEVTSLVTASGNYTVSDLTWSNGSPYCNDNSAYGAWAMIVVYEQSSLPSARIHLNTEKFQFTYPAGTYSSTISGVSLPQGCSSNAKFTIVSFEGDNYKGEGLVIGGQNFGDNNFRGQSGPNLDILSWNIPTLVTSGNTSLTYSINAYLSNTVFGSAIEGLFDYVKVLKYNVCPAPCSSVAYLWSTGATTQNIIVTQPGTYSVKVTDCAGFIARDTVIITACPLFDPNKCYKLIARHSGKVLEVGSNSTANGGIAQQQAFANGNNQKWKLEVVETDYYKLININSGKSLEVKNSGTSEGAVIQQWTWAGGNNQKWNLAKNTAGYYVIKAKHSGKVMEVKNASTSNGAAIQQGGTSGSASNQQWTVSEAGCPNGNTRSLAVVAMPKAETEIMKELSLVVQPNPGHSYFNLVIKSNDDKLPVSVRVMNISGKIITVKKTVSNTTLQVGEKWTNGIYFAEVIQGDQRKVVKIIKAN